MENLDAGRHKFFVTATDAVGNADPSAAKRSAAAALALAALATVALAAPSGAQAKEFGYVVFGDGFYTYSGYSEWKREDWDDCDITDIEEVEYEARFEVDPQPIVVSSKGEVFEDEELKTEVRQEAREVLTNDHEPETGSCGQDDGSDTTTIPSKPTPGTLTLSADVAATEQPNAYDDYRRAPGYATLSGELRTQDVFPSMLWPVASGKYVQRRFLPYTTSTEKTTKLKKGPNKFELAGKRRMLESGTSGSNHSGLWHTGWRVRWNLIFKRVE